MWWRGGGRAVQHAPPLRRVGRYIKLVHYDFTMSCVCEIDVLCLKPIQIVKAMHLHVYLCESHAFHMIPMCMNLYGAGEFIGSS